jgi:hypothetical protein
VSPSTHNQSTIHHPVPLQYHGHTSLTQSIHDQIKVDGVTLLATAAMANVEQLDQLSGYADHAKNAKNKIQILHHQH